MRTWCTYLEYSEQYGTCLGYGWAIDSKGELRGVHGPTWFLIQPEGDGEAFWKHEGSLDFTPLRREGESHEEWMARR